MLVTPTNESMYPTEIQSRLSQTIQTHNAVSVGASGSSNSAWVDCLGFTDIAVTLKNDAATSTTVDIDWSHDGTTQHGRDNTPLMSSGSSIVRAASTPIKARYARIALFNGDASAHTLSAWAYLKA